MMPKIGGRQTCRILITRLTNAIILYWAIVDGQKIEEVTSAAMEMMPIAIADRHRCIILSRVGVKIFLDSPAGIRSLSNIFLNSRSALDYPKCLIEITEQFKIHLIWVPGHKGILRNFRADALASLESTLHTPGEVETFTKPLATCNPILGNRARKWTVTNCTLSKPIRVY